MPIYEFRCACGHEFERLILRKTDHPDDIHLQIRKIEKSPCPNCGEAHVELILSMFSRGRAGSPKKPCAPIGGS